MPNWTKDDVARIIIDVGQHRGIAERGIVIALSVGLVESNLTVYGNGKVPGSLDLPHDAVGSDGMSVGVQQQQVIMGNGWWWGPVEVCQDPTGSAGLFYDRLAKKNYAAATTDAAAGAIAQSIQGSAFPDRYQARMADAQAIYDRLAGGVQPVTDPNKPPYNEFPLWSPSCSSRNGTTVDAIFLHSQEGGGGDSAAEDLAKFLGVASNQVSYHTVFSQASDGGVTVVDVVDTDEESWSVLSANARSINYCFAGSKVAWTTDQWMQQSNAIDVAAYVAVQDARKYNIPIKIIPPPYNDRIPGISDHAYVTKILGDGTHTDVGPNFPWPYFAERVNFWAAGGTTTAPPVVTTPPAFQYPSTDQMIREIWEQLRGPQAKGWTQLDGHSVVDYLPTLKDKA